MFPINDKLCSPLGKTTNDCSDAVTSSMVSLSLESFIARHQSEYNRSLWASMLVYGNGVCYKRRPSTDNQHQLNTSSVPEQCTCLTSNTIVRVIVYVNSIPLYEVSLLSTLSVNNEVSSLLANCRQILGECKIFSIAYFVSLDRLNLSLLV